MKTFELLSIIGSVVAVGITLGVVVIGSVANMRLFTGLCLAALLLSGCGSGGVSREAPEDGADRVAETTGEESSDPTTPTTHTPEEIRTALDGVIQSADTEIFSFGGAVATCQALSCPQAERIYVRRGQTSAVADTSGFEFSEMRRGVLLARKVHTTGSTLHRSFAGWMEHGFFLVEVNETSAYGTTFVDYEVHSVGDSTGTNPAAPVAGSVTWSGAMAGLVESSASDNPTVSDNDDFLVGGDARITLPRIAAGAPAIVNILFSNIVDGETGKSFADMAWEGVRLTDGAFGAPRIIAPVLADDIDISGKAIATGIYGRFHGPGHEEVGGVFRRDGITGVFGARRDE